MGLRSSDSADGDRNGADRKLVLAALGVVLLACSTEGWLNGTMAIVVRIVTFAAALCLMIPEGYTDVVGVGLAVGIFIYQRWRNGSDPGAKIPSAARA